MADKPQVPEQRVKMGELMLGRPLYQYQADILVAGLDPSTRWRIINSSRQVGKSTTIAIEAAIDSLFNYNSTILLVSLTETKAALLLDMVRKSIQSLGDQFYKEQVLRDTYTELTFRNGSRIVSLTQEPNNARGYTANQVYIDEMAHLKWQDQLLEAVAPAAIREGKVLISSTPNGVGNLFHQLWVSDNTLWKKSIPWTDCPDLSPEMMELERDRLVAEGSSFDQEYCCSFERKAQSIWNWTELSDITTSTWDEEKKGVRVLGWDPAQTRHSSAVCILQKRGKKVELIHLVDLKGLPYPEQADRVMQLCKEHQVSTVLLDEGGVGKAAYDLLAPIQSRVKRMNFTKKFKVQTAHSIKAEADRHNFTVREIPLSDQLKQDLYMFNPDSGTFPETKKGHGDFGCALFLAWSEIKTNRTSGFRPISNTSSIRASQPCLADRQSNWRW